MRIGIRNVLAILMSVLTFAVVCPSVYGQDSTSSGNEWEFFLTPYLWMAGLDGDVAVKGIRSSVDIDFSDIFENLDFGALLNFEARKGKWALFFDPTYMRLTTDAKAGPIDIDIESDFSLVEFGVSYQLFETPLGSQGERLLSFDALAGVRYTYLKADLDFPSGPDADASKDWVDPILGGRLRADLTEKLLLVVRADFGGFEVGSDFTWNLAALFGYRVWQSGTLWLGYRALGVDYDDGRGRNLFEYDVRMTGPILGLTFRF